MDELALAHEAQAQVELFAIAPHGLDRFFLVGRKRRPGARVLKKRFSSTNFLRHCLRILKNSLRNARGAESAPRHADPAPGRAESAPGRADSAPGRAESARRGADSAATDRKRRKGM